MIKKNFKNFVFLVVLVLAMGGTPSAESFELVGAGTRTFEAELEGGEIVQPGGVISITITNNSSGYQRFFLFLESEEDADGNSVLLWGTFVGGTNCRPGTTCTFDVPNVPQLGIPAEYVGVTGFFGGAGARASVTTVTSNP